MARPGPHRVVVEDDLDALCQTVRGVLECDAVVIATWHGDATSVGAVGVDYGEAGELASHFHPDEAAASRRTGEANAITVDQSSTRSLIGRIGFASLVRAPLTLGDEAAGLLFVLSRTAPANGSHDLRLVHALVRSCESALEFGRDAATPSLSEIDSLVLRAQSFPALMPAIENVVSAAIGPVAVGLSVHDEESGLLLTAENSFGLARDITSRYFIDPNDLHSNAARVYETQRPFVSNHVIGDPAVLQNYPIAFGIDSMIALPLTVSGRSLGVLMVANKAGGFAPDDVDQAAMLAPRIAIAVELARLSEVNRFELDAEHVVWELGIATVEPILDLVRFELPLRSLAAITQADHLEITGPSGALLTVHSPVAGSRFRVDLPCGVFNGQPLRLRVSRSYGRGFSRRERNVLQQVAHLLAEGLARTTALRQEAELAQHRERQRIADDLHDDVSQLLFAAQMTLEPYVAAAGEDALAARKAADLVGRAESALRDAIFVLNMPQRSLSEAVKQVVTELESQWRMEISLSLDRSIDPYISPVVATALARGTREALMNVAKHAAADHVTVVARLAGDRERVELTVRDDGRGAGMGDVAGGGHGLAALRRRIGELGGSLDVDSRARAGTTVTIAVPLSVSSG